MSGQVYDVYISELRYGYVRVSAETKEEAEEFGRNMYKKEHGNIRWHEHELADVSAGEPIKGEDGMKEKIKNLLESEDWAENCEKIMEAFDTEYESDTDTWRSKGFHLLKAVLEGDADGVLLSLCGWSAETLIEKAMKLKEDTDESEENDE